MSEWKEVKGSMGGDYPDTWDFEDKDTIIGRLKAKKDDVGPNNSKAYAVVTEDDDYTVWGSKILDDKLSKVPVGNMVKIKFIGWGESERSGRTWKDFKVASREPTDEDIKLDANEEKSGDVEPDEIPF